MMPFIRKTAATLLCAMLVVAVAACVQQPPGPDAGLSGAGSAQGAKKTQGEPLMVLEDMGEAGNQMFQEYMLARLEMKMLYEQVKANAVTPEEVEEAKEWIMERWKRVEKLADKVLRKTSS